MMIRSSILSLLMLAAATVACAAPDAKGYDKDGKIDQLNVGTYFWGDEVSTEDLAGKVVLVQIAGL